MPVSRKNGAITRTETGRPSIYRFRPLSEIGRGVSIYCSALPFRYTTRGAASMREVIAKEFSTIGLNGNGQ
jgi:hypothetical protein